MPAPRKAIQNKKETVPISTTPLKRDRYANIVYVGYMDEYFKNCPPIPRTNVIIHNTSFEIVQDNVGSW